MMTLRSYLRLRSISVEEIARQIGVHMTTVYRWMAGADIKVTEALKIAEITEGAVPVESWGAPAAVSTQVDAPARAGVGKQA